MKRALIAAALAALMASLAPVGSAQAQHMPRLEREAADAALAAIRLDGADNEFVSFGRAHFRSGIYTFTDVVLHEGVAEPGEDDAPTEMRAARMILDSPRLDAGGNLLLHAFVLENISIDDGETRTGIDRIVIERPNAAMSADLGHALRGDARDDDALPWNQYRFGLVVMDNLVATNPDGEQAFSLSLERLAFIDYTVETLGRFEMTGFAYDGPGEAGPVHLGLESLTIDGMVTAAYARFMEAGAAGASQAALMAAYYDASLDNNMQFADRMALNDLRITASGIGITLDELTMTAELQGTDMVSRAQMGSLQIRQDGDSPAANAFSDAIGRLGYDHLDLGLEANTRFDTEAGRAYTNGINQVTLRDGLSIEFTQDIGGYFEYIAALNALAAPDAEAKTAADSDAMMLPAMAPLTIHNLGIRLVDQSMLERALAAGAARQDITPEEMRSQAAILVMAGVMSAPPEMPQALLMELATAVSSFIAQGGTLEIVMQPPTPVTIGEIRAQSEAGAIDFEALGLGASAEAPPGR